ncbi:MAG: 4Fe-4S dicluster domain-containing protein [Anaerolineae bacterium]|nr:4Fe-4S dicluster domain-containing protein [Anaerolineae bacterium]
MKAAEKSTLFDRVVKATPGGEALAQCLQCGSCGGSCPSAVDMDHSPRALFAMINAGMEDEVLGSNTPWYCVSCYACTTRCPQNIPITDIMYTLKQMAVQRGHYDHPHAIKFSETFIGFVEQRGRGFEFGLATRYHLFHRPKQFLQPTQVFKMGAMGANMMRRQRLPVRPVSIREIDQLQAILAKAKVVAAKEMQA